MKTELLMDFQADEMNLNIQTVIRAMLQINVYGLEVSVIKESHRPWFEEAIEAGYVKVLNGKFYLTKKVKPLIETIQFAE